MKYFLDSAKIDEILYAYENWGIDGVTTNPKHVLLSGKPFKQVIKELASHFEKIDFPISIEINPHLNNPDEMVKEAKEYASYSKNFIIKIPCTEPGIIAAKKLAKDSIRVNMTLVFSASQALIAGKIGAYYVSPFIGWKESSGEPTIQYIKDVVQIYRNYNFKTQIIVAAVRNGNQIVEAAKANADIVTAGFDVYKESFYHPFTDLGLKRFCDAWDATKKE
jgi:transaldolase